jgi:hypothetical protein
MSNVIMLIPIVLYIVTINNYISKDLIFDQDRRGHDRMVVGFTSTYAIGAYHH